MHIKQAKEQIKNAILAYSTKDAYGRYRIPAAKQRPVFLVGAPGVGKTAIVEQIAKELDIGFVSYAMTHHTRQSALGLPFIVEKQFGGKTFSVSEYTMSEILASVYDEMERTGKKQGILFLDEINCVSETLAPSMLQFLQYKTFGRHSVPEGWIVVTAGNPPEYNDSVREFDIAMLDRLKKIEVEPDLEVWREFAVNNSVHSSVLSYLAIKPHHFYRVTATVDGKSFVTARAWDDLSQMITLYEENRLKVDSDLISQYIQDEEIAKDFANYYDLYRKYRSDYQVTRILEGTVPPEIIARAKGARFDERLSLISLLLSALEEEISETVQLEDTLRTVIPEIRNTKVSYPECIKERIGFYRKKSRETDTAANVDLAFHILKFYEDLAEHITGGEAAVRNHLKKAAEELKVRTARGQDMLSHLFSFFEECFGSSQEMLILVSELTIRPAASRFIYLHGCEKYYQYNRQLLFEDRQNTLKERIEALNLPSFDHLEV